MKKNGLLALVLFMLILQSSCFRQNVAVMPTPTESGDKLELLYTYMQGSFNSAAQAEADTNYYDISLEMHPIWTEREGLWLYVEQALSARKEAPYRQRIYLLSYDPIKEMYASSVYKIPDEKEYIGKWNDDIFNDLDFSDLEVREGCAVYLKHNSDGSFKGSTTEKDCLSSLRGSTYATAKVNVYADSVESWDQGYNDSGEQVWGATQGPYVFQKMINKKQ